MSLTRSGKFISLVEANFPHSATNQKYYPDLGNDTSFLKETGGGAVICQLLSQPRNLFTVCIAEGRVVHIMLNVTHYYANNSLCSTNGTI